MNYNTKYTRTMNGLNTFNGDSVNCIEITSENATITKDLTVGNNATVGNNLNVTKNIYADTINVATSITTQGTIDASGNIFNNGNFTSLGVTKIGPGALIAGSGIANRTFNVLSNEGGIKLARNNATSGAFIEFDSVTPDWATINNRVFIGGSTPADERFLVRFGLAPSTFDSFVIRRTGVTSNTSLSVTGDLSFSGKLTNDTTSAYISLATSYIGCRGDITSNYIGVNSGATTTTLNKYNICLGYKAGYSINDSLRNIFIGNQAGYSTVTSGYNTAIGDQALWANTAGNNVAVGQKALFSNTTGTDNVAVGQLSGTTIGASSYNTSVGGNAGYNINGNYNTAIGYGAWATGGYTAINNSTSIGYNSRATASNQVVLGTSSETVIIPNTITFSDGTIQRSSYINDILNDTQIHSLCNGSRTILQSTFNLGNATNATLSSLNSGVHVFVAVQIVKDQTYTGISFFTGTAGTYNTALYASGLNPARLAYSNPLAATASSWGSHVFTVSYKATYTGIAFIAIRTTSATQTVLALPANIYANYGFGNPANSTLNRRSQICTNAAGFLNPYAAAIAMTNNQVVYYAYLY